MTEKILFKGSWFHPVKSSTIYEGVYEKRILANSSFLFPGFYCASFKKPVESRHGTGIPDLVLIDKRYRAWVVVEVELETHSLQSDVELQVMQFANGEYYEEHAKYIHSKLPDLDIQRLTMLVLGTLPTILVIVPIVKPSWAVSLRSHRATISQIELFEDDTKQQLIRFDGDTPVMFESEFVSRLFRDGSSDKGLRMENPGAIENLDVIFVLVSGYGTSWRVIRTKSSIWLMPTSRDPLSDLSARSFKLMINSSGDYFMEEER